MFEPPDAAGYDLAAMELAADELEHQARKRASTPLPVDEPVASSQRRSRPSLGEAAVADAAPAPARAPTLRVRFAAGVVVAILLGFLPAHFIAQVRERSAFREIDDHVAAVQSRTDAPLDAAALDAFRAEQLDRKQSERRSIALASMAIWALLGAGIAYVWFRRIPWDRLPHRR